MLLAIAVHLVLAAVLLPLARRLGRWVFVIAALSPAVTLGWVLTRAGPVLSGEAWSESIGWAPRIGLEGALRLDALGLLMTVLVTGIGALVLVYYAYYVKPGEGGVGSTAALLSVFSGAMLGLVVADDVFTLYIFWELTTLCSFLLVGGNGSRAEARRASVQALLVTVLGGLALLLGFVLLADAAGTYRVSEIVANPPSGPSVNVALILLLVGAFTKSAQVPFHPWLPGAMVAPAPVSAYLHAAAMVKAGIYLLARFAPAFGDVPAWWVPAVLIGGWSMIFAGYRALLATDLKELLAYGTVSQLGMLTVLVAVGERTAALAGGAMLLAHGLFKSALFLAAGVLDRQTGSRDIRELSGLGRRMPVLASGCVLAVASMAGLPPLLGFVGKEAAFEAFAPGSVVDVLILAGLVIGSMITVAYGIRFLWGAFGTKRGQPATEVRAPPAGLLLPAMIPALAGAVFGAATPLTAALVEPTARGLPAGGEPYHVALWHGFGLPVVASVLAITGGFAVFRAQPLVRRLGGRLPGALHAQHGYQRVVTGLDDLAHRVTGRVQVGSLPGYLSVILLSVVLVSGAGLASGVPLPDDWRWWDNPLQVPLALFVLVAAGSVISARRRFTAVLLTGVVGYGIGALFVVDGAPDLALAQFLVESLVLVVFVFVLRRFPAHFTHGGPVRALRWRNAAIASGAGAFVAVASVLYSAARRHAPVASREYAARAEPEAGATNVVEAILVDFRALDTVGEIAVLAIAATGAASLILAAQREPRQPEPEVETTSGAEPPAEASAPSASENEVAEEEAAEQEGVSP
ncbi:MAG: DUF4040 domain-containing protein [Pseudonocardiaceae bacterium]|nr:DUF4040 domain-containing protein [Pseudonocardiaceae bacterium]